MWRALSITAFLLVVIIRSNAEASGCEDKIKSVVDGFDPEWSSAFPNIRVLSSRPGKHGGDQYLVRRRENAWGSKFALHVLDAEGDPRTFAGVFGEETARFFGFEKVDTDLWWLPSAREFIGALHKVKAKMLALVERGQLAKDFIPLISFYPQDENDADWMNTYLVRYSNDHALPIGSFDFADDPQNKVAMHSWLHDISYHTSGGLLTHPTALKLSAEQTKTHLRFANAYEERFKVEMEPNLNEIATLWRLVQIMSIDTGTANFGLSLAGKLETKDLNTFHEELARYYRWLVQQSHDSLSYTGFESSAYRADKIHFVTRKYFEDAAQSRDWYDYFHQYINLLNLWLPQDFEYSDAFAETHSEESRLSQEEVDTVITIRADSAAPSKTEVVSRLCEWTLNMRNAIVSAVAELTGKAIEAPPAEVCTK